MSKHRTARAVQAGFLFLLLALPILGQEPGAKIKVIVENASIRLNPSLDSDAIVENVAPNTVFIAEKKIGEWYEVKFKSELGILLVGYIHEMCVEVLTEKPAPPPTAEEKKPAVKEKRQPIPRLRTIGRAGLNRMELFAGMGVGIGSSVSETTSYSASWNWNLTTVNEGGQIQHKISKNPFGLGFSFSFFLKELGIRLRADPNFGQKIIDGESQYHADFSWTFSGGGSYSITDSWNGFGYFYVIPISLDLVYRTRFGSFIPYVNAGFSYFMSGFKVDSNMGVASTWWTVPGVSQAYDHIDIPLKINEPLNSSGYNFGAGCDLLLGPNLAATLDVIFFRTNKKELSWPVTPGRYYFVNRTDDYIDISEEVAQYLSESLGKISVDVSFYKILLGIKVIF